VRGIFSASLIFVSGLPGGGLLWPNSELVRKGETVAETLPAATILQNSRRFNPFLNEIVFIIQPPRFNEF